MPIILAHAVPTIEQAVTYQQSAAEAEAQADEARTARDQVVRQLNTADPTRWTVKALASALGLSATTIRRALG